jgi:hypothetical protein
VRLPIGNIAQQLDCPSIAAPGLQQFFSTIRLVIRSGLRKSTTSVSYKHTYVRFTTGWSGSLRRVNQCGCSRVGRPDSQPLATLDLTGNLPPCASPLQSAPVSFPDMKRAARDNRLCRPDCAHPIPNPDYAENGFSDGYIMPVG